MKVAIGEIAPSEARKLGPGERVIQYPKNSTKQRELSIAMFTGIKNITEYIKKDNVEKLYKLPADKILKAIFKHTIGNEDASEFMAAAFADCELTKKLDEKDVKLVLLDAFGKVLHFYHNGMVFNINENDNLTAREMKDDETSESGVRLMEQNVSDKTIKHFFSNVKHLCEGWDTLGKGISHKVLNTGDNYKLVLTGLDLQLENAKIGTVIAYDEEAIGTAWFGTPNYSGITNSADITQPWV